MNAAPLAALALVAVLATGCFDIHTHPQAFFDGDAAHAFVERMVEDGAAQRRVPGDPGHRGAALDLLEEAEVPGWDVRLESFNGSQYAALQSEATQRYRGEPWCNDPDAQQLATLEFHNIVADRPLDEAPTWLLGAHWDAKEEANHDPDPDRRTDPVPGANDGASGVGVLLQLMRHIEQGALVPAVGLQIVFFDGEDGFEDCHPLAGSMYHASRLAPGEVDAMILLDMVGDPDGRFIKEQRSVQSAPGLVDVIWAHAQDVGDDRFIAPALGNSWHCAVLDDHVPFVEAGIPSVDIIDYGRSEPQCAFPPYWHTTADDMRNISPEALGLIGDVLWLTLQDPGT